MPFTTFGTPREEFKFESKFKKTSFLDLNTTSTVRILTNGYLPVQTHYVNRTTVQCIGEHCPICANNKALIMQFPDTFKDEPKYSPRRTVNLVNVLDKTPVRVCPKCQTENHVVGQAPTTCKCGEILTGTPTPSMKIKVLSRGVTLFDQLDAINNAIMDASGERVGLTGYDLTFVVSGSGKNKTITPIPGQMSPIEAYNETELYDLENVTLKFSPTEMIDLQRGVSLKDIFAARKATEKSESIQESVLPKELLDSVQSDVDALFGKVD
jgi:hypothetical protein